MGFRLNVEGGDSIQLGIESIKNVKYKTDTPNDSNARSKDVGATLYVTGKILTAIGGGANDSTKNLGKWSLIPAEKADCYRRVTVEVVSAEQIVRKITFPNAFVIDYTEHYGDTEGIGTFDLVVRQKKDKLSDVTVEGGYGA